MFGIWRRGNAVVVPAVAALVLLLGPRPARADDGQQSSANTLFGFQGEAAPSEAEEKALNQGLRVLNWATVLDRVWSDDKDKDFHPETDRWTERNNRIKISLYGGGWFFARNLRIEPDAFLGLRLSWEVPGFIAVRLENATDPIARMRVRLPNFGNDSTRHAQHGFVNCTSLSVAIFNPELSWPANIAMWGGLGLDLWTYHFVDRGINSSNQVVRFTTDFQHNFVFNANPGLNFFFDLEYKIIDIFHVGIMYRQHIIYAPETELGEFYKINGSTASHNHHGRNGTRPADLTTVEELSLSVSVLF
jgi:hypothetical protein